jgi:hypothetical protein
MTNKEAIEELKKVDTLDMPARLCEAHYMAIKALEQEPKTGHWINDNGIYAWCSCCKEDIYQTGEFKYCPNCGCRMVEPQESEEV